MMSRGSEVRKIVSMNENDFTDHIVHYKNVHVPNTSRAEFVYVENSNEYVETESQFWQFLAGRTKAIVTNRNLGIAPALVSMLRGRILNWISRTQGARLFEDLIVIWITGADLQTDTLTKECFDIDDLNLLRQAQGRVYVFSAIWLWPKIPKKNREKFLQEADPLFGFFLIDIKQRQTICFGIRTLRQCLGAYGKPPNNDLSMFIREMVNESLTANAALTILARPALNSEYTAVPWLTFACISDIFQSKLQQLSECQITIPEFLGFGYYGAVGQFNSFMFRRAAQSAAVNLKLRCSGSEFLYNLRFDLSPGQPTLHVDFQIYASGHPMHKKKLLAHDPISLSELWNLSRPLYLGFLAAGGYDAFFDRLIEERLEEFRIITSQNAAAGYPLMLRVYDGPREDWLRGNPLDLQVLLKIAAEGVQSLSGREKNMIPDLVRQKLFKDGGLTLSGEMLATKLRP